MIRRSEVDSLEVEGVTAVRQRQIIESVPRALYSHQVIEARRLDPNGRTF